MSESAEAVIELASKLTVSERLEVYEALERGLGPNLQHVDEAMLDRRWAEIESGAVKCLSKDEFLKKLKSRPLGSNFRFTRKPWKRRGMPVIGMSFAVAKN